MSKDPWPVGSVLMTSFALNVMIKKNKNTHLKMKTGRKKKYKNATLMQK